MSLRTESAYAQAVKRLRPRLVEIAEHRIGNYDDAEDCAGEVILRALELEYPETSGEIVLNSGYDHHLGYAAPLLAWCRGILSHVVDDYWRARGRRNSKVVPNPTPEQLHAAEARAGKEAHEAEQALLRSDLARAQRLHEIRLRMRFAQLSKRSREALLALAEEGTTRRAGLKLGICHSTVSRRTQGAIRTILSPSITALIAPELASHGFEPGYVSDYATRVQPRHGRAALVAIEGGNVGRGAR